MAHNRPVRITNARTSHTDDIQARKRRYLISMAIRTVCVVLAVVVGSGPLRWVFIVGAVVLPYIAVIIANAGARTDPDDVEAFHDDSRRMLPPDHDGEA